MGGIKIYDPPSWNVLTKGTVYCFKFLQTRISKKRSDLTEISVLKLWGFVCSTNKSFTIDCLVLVSEYLGTEWNAMVIRRTVVDKMSRSRQTVKRNSNQD